MIFRSNVWTRMRCAEKLTCNGRLRLPVMSTEEASRKCHQRKGRGGSEWGLAHHLHNNRNTFPTHTSSYRISLSFQNYSFSFQQWWWGRTVWDGVHLWLRSQEWRPSFSMPLSKYGIINIVGGRNSLEHCLLAMQNNVRYAMNERRWSSLR